MSYKIALERIAQAKKEKATTLHLYRLDLKEIPKSLSELTQLTSLSLSSNQLTEIKGLEKLTKLTNLSLSSNQLTEIKGLEKLTQLTNLDLSYNQLIEIKGLEKLTKLTSLYFYDNQLAEIKGLEKLIQLTSLDLSYNQLTEIKGLEKLTKLTELYLYNNQLTKIRGLEKLTQLIELYLSYNQLTKIRGLEKLTQLTYLYLSFNKLTEIKGLDNSIQLTELRIDNNQLTEIKGLEKLTQLKNLHLDSNQLTEIPLSLLDFNLNILWETDLGSKGIAIAKNPITTPPVETIQQGNEAIRNYLEQLQKGEKQYLLEAKLLLIGAGGAGKTTLAKKIKEGLKADMPGDDDTTRGIDILEFDFPVTWKEELKAKEANFRMNIWDFGGQAIYHATHQFFLTRRSLYVLVMDARTEGHQTTYWCQVVELLGDGSPLIIVENKKQGYKQIAFNFPSYKERFDNICSPMLHSDFEKDHDSLESVIADIKHRIQLLPGMGDELPEAWVNVRKAIEKEGKDYISQERYVELCAVEDLDFRQALRLSSDYLHPVGVFLHFQDNPVLKNTVILDNEWATDAVYAVVKNKKIIEETQGYFSKEDLALIWSDKKYEQKQAELLALMEEFELCYQAEGGTYIAPQLLSDKQPEYDLPAGKIIHLFYEYGFMPKGLLHRFIVRMHLLIAKQEWVWQQGVVLHLDGETYAEVVESYDSKQIHISCTGVQPKKLMDMIIDEIDAINSTFKNIRVKKQVRCICPICQAAKPTKDDELPPNYYTYKDLQRRLEKDKKTVECKFSFEDVNVIRLLQNISEKFSRHQLFISYSRKDKKLFEEVKTHLNSLKYTDDKITYWDDAQINAGMQWREEIQKALSTTKVALLLVSPDFLASSFINEVEIPHFLEAAKNDGATILIVVIRPCDVAPHQLSQYQFFNAPEEALSKLTKPKRDEKLVKLNTKIRHLMS